MALTLAGKCKKQTKQKVIQVMIDCTETHSSVAREPGYEEDSKKHKSNKINKE